jgi:hypothetical protein
MAIEMPKFTGGGQQKEVTTIIMLLIVLVVVVGFFVSSRRIKERVESVEGTPVATEPSFDVSKNFVPLGKVSGDYIEDYTFDRKQFPKDATEIVNDFKAVFHAVRYLRTVEAGRTLKAIEEIAAKAGYKDIAEARTAVVSGKELPGLDEKQLAILTGKEALPGNAEEGPFGDEDYVKSADNAAFVPEEPEDYAKIANPPDLVGELPRGKQMRITGRLIKKYTDVPMSHLEGVDQAGLANVSCCVFRSMESNANDEHLFLVVSPVDLSPWLRTKLVALDVVFLKVWPLPLDQAQTVWRWMPMVVGLRPQLVEIPGDKESTYLKIALGVIVLALLIFAVLGRRESASAPWRKKHAHGGEVVKQEPVAGGKPAEKDAPKTDDKPADKADEVKTGDKPADEPKAGEKSPEKKDDEKDSSRNNQG